MRDRKTVFLKLGGRPEQKKPTWFNQVGFLKGGYPKNYLIAATFLANFDLMLPALFL